MSPRHFCSLDHILSGSAGASVENIFKYSAGKQVYILLYHSDIGAQASQGNIPYIHSVNGDSSPCCVIKSGQQITECSFSAAGRAN